MQHNAKLIALHWEFGPSVATEWVFVLSCPPLGNGVNVVVRWFFSVLWLPSTQKGSKMFHAMDCKALLNQPGFSHVLCNPTWGLTHGLISHPAWVCLIHLSIVSFKIRHTIFITLSHHRAFHFYLSSSGAFRLATTPSWNGKQWFFTWFPSSSQTWSERWCVVCDHQRGPCWWGRGAAWTSVRSGTSGIFKDNSTQRVSFIVSKIKLKILILGSPFWPIRTAQHLFSQAFIEHLSYTRLCCRLWDHSGEQDREYLSSGRWER